MILVNKVQTFEKVKMSLRQHRENNYCCSHEYFGNYDLQALAISHKGVSHELVCCLYVEGVHRFAIINHQKKKITISL